MWTNTSKTTDLGLHVNKHSCSDFPASTPILIPHTSIKWSQFLLCVHRISCLKGQQLRQRMICLNNVCFSQDLQRNGCCHGIANKDRKKNICLLLTQYSLSITRIKHAFEVTYTTSCLWTFTSSNSVTHMYISVHWVIRRAPVAMPFDWEQWNIWWEIVGAI